MKSRLLLEFQGTKEEYDRLKAYIRQNSNTTSIVKEDVDGNLLHFFDLKIDLERREIFLDEKKISLTAREFDILSFLARNSGKAFSHRQIYEAVWKNEYYRDAANITAHIGHIRKKIEKNPSSPGYIQTVHGVGYKFMEKGEA